MKKQKQSLDDLLSELLAPVELSAKDEEQLAERAARDASKVYRWEERERKLDERDRCPTCGYCRMTLAERNECPKCGYKQTTHVDSAGE